MSSKYRFRVKHEVFVKPRVYQSFVIETVLMRDGHAVSPGYSTNFEKSKWV